MVTYKEELCNYTFVVTRPRYCWRACLQVGRDFIRVIVEADEVWSLEY
jgi:hypothetical protein